MTPTDIKSMLDKGNALINQNLLEAARTLFAVCMEHFPGQIAPMERYAHVCLLCRDHEAAYRAYRAMAASFPKNPAGCLGQGNVLLRLGLVDEAEAFFARCAEDFPAEPRIRERQGQIAHQRGNFDDAYAWFAALRASHPDNPAGYLGLGTVLLELELFDEAGELFGEAIARFPNNPGLKERYALTALRGLDFDAAYVRYARLDREHPGSPAGWLGLGNVLVAQHLYDEAEEHFRRGMDRFPSTPGMMDRHAQIALLTLDHDEAFARYAAFCRAYPDAPSGYIGLGDILLKQRLTDEAEAVLREGLARVPEHPVLRQRYAMAAIRRWDFDEAMSRFEELMRLEPNNPLGYIGKANVLLQLNRQAEAVPFITCCMRRFPQNFVFRGLYAFMAFQRSKFDVAVPRYQAIVDMFPRASTGYLGLIRIMLKRKQFDDAHAMLVQAMPRCRQDMNFLQSVISFYMDALFVNIHIVKPEITDMMFAAYALQKRDEVVGPCFDAREQWKTQLVGARTIARAVASQPCEAGSGRVRDGRTSLLIFGDSAVVAVFRCFSAFADHGVKARLFPTPGASIAGLGKRYSTLSLMPKIEKCISKFAPDYVMLRFGQVDIEYGYYHKKFIKRRYDIDFESYCDNLIDIYIDAAMKMRDKTKIVICSINLPSVYSRGCYAKKTQDIISFGEVSNEVSCFHKSFALQPSITHRTKMVVDFNRMLGTRCRDRGLAFIDQTPIFLDRERGVLHEYLRDDEDTHYVTSKLHRKRIIDYTMERLLAF